MAIPDKRATTLPIPRQPAATLLQPGNFQGQNARNTTGFTNPSPLQPLDRPFVTQPSNALLQQYVEANPGVMQARLAQRNQGNQADDQFRLLLSQAIAGYGDPSIASRLGLAVDPQTAALAQANTTAGHSQVALLNLAAAHARDAMLTHLTSTGLLHSGEVGFETGLNNQAASLARFNAAQKIQNQLGTANQQNLATHQTLNDAVTNAITSAQPSGPLPGPQLNNFGVIKPTAAPHPNIPLPSIPKPVALGASTGASIGAAPGRIGP